jgi:polyisoprenoid-binding protein YceI
MKTLFIETFLALLVLSLSSLSFAAETYVLDPGHTFVLWHINHFGFSNPTGKWMANGTLVLDEKDPKNSKVNVMIPLANLSTGIPKLDEHLNSKDFFDAETYKTATFVSNKVDVTSKDTARVYGVLTLNGVSKPAVLDVTLNKIGVSPITNKKTAGFSAKTTLKRSDFGINKYLPGLGDDVTIEIEAEGATG